jgi:uncharacterized repeat protein (TIGR04076 family)
MHLYIAFHGSELESGAVGETEMYDCKITVIKRSVNRDIVNDYLKDEYQEIKPCERFKDGQEFVIAKEDRYRPPEGFCEWAWADIRQDILALAYGGKPPHMKNENANIAGCTDWFRPVYFKIERVE